MNKNLGWKLVAIVGILLVFLAGIFGIPKEWSGKGILASIADRIHLGLDLRGGTHLILQVQVNDAVNVDSDNAIARLKEDMRTRKINYAEIAKPDPINHPEAIVVKGITPDQTSDFKSIVSDRLPEYGATSGAENSWTVAMKAQSLSDLKNRAVSQAIETIRNRIDQLGVSEPVIQEHGLGQYQILVQLPGVDDPARVKAIHGDAGNQAIAGWTDVVLERAGGVTGAWRRAASGRDFDAGQEHRIEARYGKRRIVVHHHARLGGHRARSSDGGTGHRRKWASGCTLHSDQRGWAEIPRLHFRARRRLAGGGAR
jgi:preprotein translocase subunit SecD